MFESSHMYALISRLLSLAVASRNAYKVLWPIRTKIVPSRPITIQHVPLFPRLPPVPTPLLIFVSSSYWFIMLFAAVMTVSLITIVWVLQHSSEKCYFCVKLFWFRKSYKQCWFTFALCSLKSSSLKSSFEIRIFANSLLKNVQKNK